MNPTIRCAAHEERRRHATRPPTKYEWEAAARLDGLFAGLLAPEEYEPLIEVGALRKSYEGAAGFMGLAKLRMTVSLAEMAEARL